MTSQADTGAPVVTAFPVLSSTQLCLELLVQKRTLDLRAVRDLLCRDPGAVLRLYARAAWEFPDPQERPERLEDCIVSVPQRSLLEAMHHPPSPGEDGTALLAFARHSHAIACFASAAAASLGLGAERAFLTGLLHAAAAPAGHLRSQNANPEPVWPAHRTPVELALGCLPPKLFAAVEAVHLGRPGSVWVALMQAAHDLSETLSETNGPQNVAPSSLPYDSFLQVHESEPHRRNLLFP